jgi:hypothetical protein
MKIQEQLDFADLNPTVHLDDERRLSRQANKLHNKLKYYKRMGIPVTNHILVECIGHRYSARMQELRLWLIKHRDQCVDDRRGKGGLWYYWLVPVSESKYYAKRKHKLAHLRQNKS